MKIKPNYTKISQILCVSSILFIVAWKSLEQKNYIGHSYKSIAADPLPSWNDGKVKKSIIDFVSKVTQEGSADFIPANDRIATFDNDGTLWAEQPMYFQFLFAVDRIRAIAPQHPDWKTEEPYNYKSILEGNIKKA